MTTNKPTNNAAYSLWAAVLADLQLQVTRPVFETWLKETHGTTLENGFLIIDAPNSFVIETLESRLFTSIEATLLRISGTQLNIVFEIQKVGDDDYLSPDPETNAPTFDNFIVGPSNKIAYSTTKTLAEMPTLNHTPLYLYSGPGLGKTHLLQAIFSNVKKKRKTSVYVSAEEFTYDFVTSVQKGADTPRIYRQKYRTPDVLLIDDIQFLLGKKKTIEFFLNTLSSRIQKNKVVVVAGDRPPSYFSPLDARLTSMLSGGITVNISPPEKKTITNILEKTCLKLNLKIKTEIETYILEHSPPNTRSLIGFLKTLSIIQKNKRSPLSLIEIKKLLNEIIGTNNLNEPTTLNPEEILLKISDHFGLSVERLQSSSRDRKTTEARHNAMYLLRKKTSLTLREIGLLLGGRDHASVALAINKIHLNPDPIVVKMLV